jgi:hypothetical protein
VRAAAAHHRAGIMRRDHPPRQGDIGKVVTEGMDSRVERQGRTAEAESLSRAEG